MSCSLFYNLVMALVGMIRMSLCCQMKRYLFGICGVLSLCNLSCHCISLHHKCIAYGVMLLLDSHNCTNTTSFIRYNDAALYFVEYEDRRHGICIYGAFGFLWHSLAMVVRSESSLRFSGELVLFMHVGVEVFMYEGVELILFIFSLRSFACR